MPQSKQVRVRVLRSFQGYAPDGEEKPIHRVGAVIDLDENDARAEFHIKRCEEVDPSTKLCEGLPEKETTGETLEQIREREAAEKKAAEGDIRSLVAAAVAEALGKAKK